MRPRNIYAGGIKPPFTGEELKIYSQSQDGNNQELLWTNSSVELKRPKSELELRIEKLEAEVKSLKRKTKKVRS